MLRAYNKDGTSLLAEPGSALALKLVREGFMTPIETVRCEAGYSRDLALARRIVAAVAARDRVAIQTTSAH